MPKKRKLSPRELEIYNLLIQGYSRKNIIHKLFIAKSTLDWHIVHIYEKKNVKNRVELIQKHYKGGLC